MKKESNGHSGIIAMTICGIITIAIIVACIFFPEEVFGLFM